MYSRISTVDEHVGGPSDQQSDSDAKLQLLSCMYNVHILITYVSCLYLSNEKTSRATSHHPIIFESPSINVTLHLQNKGSYMHCGILSGSG